MLESKTVGWTGAVADGARFAAARDVLVEQLSARHDVGDVVAEMLSALAGAVNAALLAICEYAAERGTSLRRVHDSELDLGGLPLVGDVLRYGSRREQTYDLTIPANKALLDLVDQWAEIRPWMVARAGELLELLWLDRWPWLADEIVYMAAAEVDEHLAGYPDRDSEARRVRVSRPPRPRRRAQPQSIADVLARRTYVTEEQAWLELRFGIQPATPTTGSLETIRRRARWLYESQCLGWSDRRIAANDNELRGGLPPKYDRRQVHRGIKEVIPIVDLGGADATVAIFQPAPADKWVRF